MTRTAKLYLIITSIAILGIVGLIHLGDNLPMPPPSIGDTGQVAPPAVAHTSVPTSGSIIANATSSLFQNSSSALGRLFLQLFIVIVAASIIGGLFTRIGQPAVVGEMIAGILLGPSLF